MIQPIVSSSRPITLIGGAKPAPDTLYDALNYGETVVCADGGADLALEQGIKPAAVIGDLDSISDAARSAFKGVLHHIPEQDSTDFDKGLRHVDAPLVLGVGFSGARLDHELAALNVMVRRADRRCILIGAETITFICPPELALDTATGTQVSLFPMAEVGCDSTGLKWDTTGLRFAPDGQGGTSNEALGPVTLRPDRAKMLVILPRDALALTVQALLQSDVRWSVPAK